jgi:hypothetical protein
MTVLLHWALAIASYLHAHLSFRDDGIILGCGIGAGRFAACRISLDLSRRSGVRRATYLFNSAGYAALKCGTPGISGEVKVAGLDCNSAGIRGMCRKRH